MCESETVVSIAVSSLSCSAVNPENPSIQSSASFRKSAPATLPSAFASCFCGSANLPSMNLLYSSKITDISASFLAVMLAGSSKCCTVFLMSAGLLWHWPISTMVSASRPANPGFEVVSLNISSCSPLSRRILWIIISLPIPETSGPPVSLPSSFRISDLNERTHSLLYPGIFLLFSIARSIWYVACSGTRITRGLADGDLASALIIELIHRLVLPLPLLPSINCTAIATSLP